MIPALLIIAVAALGLLLACWWADSQPPDQTEPPHDISHVHVIDDQEPNA